jgi:hypothetical protein
MPGDAHRSSFTVSKREAELLSAVAPFTVAPEGRRFRIHCDDANTLSRVQCALRPLREQASPDYCFEVSRAARLLDLQAAHPAEQRYSVLVIG